MRIFASDVRELMAAGVSRGELARALLRYAVREYWGEEMPDIEKDSRGKPFFAGREDMHFSLSHTKTHILAAVSEYHVGADIETIRPVKEENKRLFSPEMLADFGYFGGWTLREAVFKLRGEGSLRNMDTRLLDGRIVTPFECVRCASYTVPGCAAAAAAMEGSFPEHIEIVDAEKFWPVGA